MNWVKSLGIPHELVWRQPFPGPGLGIRVIGEITPEKLEIVRESDAILREEIKKAGLDEKESGNTSPSYREFVQLVSWVMAGHMITPLPFVP